MPWVLVSNKCDNPPNARQINPQAFEKICNALGETQSFHTSFNAPETHKRCISAILRRFMPNPSGKFISEALFSISLQGCLFASRYVRTLAVGCDLLVVEVDAALASA